MNMFGEPIPGAHAGQQRTVDPQSTTGKGVPIYHQEQR
jgi:hypothetical protein